MNEFCDFNDEIDAATFSDLISGECFYVAEEKPATKTVNVTAARTLPAVAQPRVAAFHKKETVLSTAIAGAAYKLHSAKRKAQVRSASTDRKALTAVAKITKQERHNELQSQPRLMNVAEVAAYTRCSVSKIWRLDKAENRFPKAIRIDGSTRWERRAIDRYLDTLIVAK